MSNFRDICTTSLLKQNMFTLREDARVAVSIVVDELVRLARDHGYVEVRGLGTFRKVVRKPRTFYNPKTRKPVGTRARWVIVFRPSVDLKGWVDEKEARR